MKRPIAIAAGALAAYLAYGIWNAGRDDRPPPPSNANITLEGGRAHGQRLKFRSWSADYDRIVSNADQTVLDITGVHDGTIFRHGKPYLHVRAHHMTVNTLSRDFTADGPVHAETIDGVPPRSFDTTSATWSDVAQKLTLAHRVVIRTGADAPLAVGSLTLDVKTGRVAVDDVDGAVRLK